MSFETEQVQAAFSKGIVVKAERGFSIFYTKLSEPNSFGQICISQDFSDEAKSTLCDLVDACEWFSVTALPDDKITLFFAVQNQCEFPVVSQPIEYEAKLPDLRTLILEALEKYPRSEADKEKIMLQAQLTSAILRRDGGFDPSDEEGAFAKMREILELHDEIFPKEAEPISLAGFQRWTEMSGLFSKLQRAGFLCGVEIDEPDGEYNGSFTLDLNPEDHWPARISGEAKEVFLNLLRIASLFTIECEIVSGSAGFVFYP